MSDPTLPVDDVRLDASIPVAEDVDHYDPVLENIRSQTPIKDLIRSVPGVFVSIAVHLLIILVLGAVYLPQVIDFQQQIESGMEELEEVEDLDELFEQDEVKEIDLSEMNDVTDFTDRLNALGFLGDDPSKLLVGVTATAYRGDNVARYGGNEHSERAVAAALAWLAAHQLPDGSWCYNHAIAPDCRGQCRNPSDRPDIIAARNSATAMAVLPFLGAGITPKAGEKYRPVVRDGINFLKNNAIRSKEGIRFYEQNVNSYQMYHQGICSITVCEAAAMTRDKELEDLAQGAIRFICYAQHEQGGWRYAPKQAGDTSAFGWVFMALKSGQMAYLQVPPVTVKKAKSFLDTVVGYEGGARYGYDRNNGGSAAVTAIGLLSQMYMGWKADNSSLQKGADFLSATGPRANDLYYCYYATQVLHHLGGERWEKWNRAMRDALVKSQATEGHEKGSWVDGGHATVGGRIVGTSIEPMILEVYHQPLPIYTKSTTASEFPLD